MYIGNLDCPAKRQYRFTMVTVNMYKITFGALENTLHLYVCTDDHLVLNQFDCNKYNTYNM